MENQHNQSQAITKSQFPIGIDKDGQLTPFLCQPDAHNHSKPEMPSGCSPNTQVGANIQKQIGIKGFTQQSLADALGISKQVMNKIIKGSKAINVNELAKIASVMGTTTDELLRNCL